MATIQELESRLNALEKAFLQAQKNQVPVTAKVDDTSNRVTSITPYTETKTAYIGDTVVVFENVPQGNEIVFFSPNNTSAHSIERMADNLVITFEPLNEVTTVTISIQ